MTFEEIKEMKKSTFENLLKVKITEKVLEKLNREKSKHSKVAELEHETLVMQKYLKPNSAKINSNEAKLIFNLRSRMTGVKCNFKNEYENLEFRAYKMKEETQGTYFKL